MYGSVFVQGYPLFNYTGSLPSAIPLTLLWQCPNGRWTFLFVSIILVLTEYESEVK